MNNLPDGISLHGCNVTLKFGTGTVKMIVGGEKGSGVLLFRQGEPSELNIPSDESLLKSSSNANIFEYPVAMLFDKTESIDVVIETLKKVRIIVEGTFCGK